MFEGLTDWLAIAAADFTGDGQAWQHPTTGAVQIRVMSRTVYTGDARTIVSGASEWRVIGRQR